MPSRAQIILCMPGLHWILTPVTSLIKIYLQGYFRNSGLEEIAIKWLFIRLAWNRPQSGSLGGRSFTKEGRGGCLVLAQYAGALHAARCTLHTTNCTLHTAHCTLHTAHCTLHTAHCILHTAYCTGRAHYTTRRDFGVTRIMGRFPDLESP